MQIVLLTKCLELWDLIGKMKPPRQYFQLFSSNAGSTFAIESGSQEILWCYSFVRAFT